MSAFVVFTRENVRDQVELDIYSSAVPVTFEGHERTILAAYGALERIEGSTPEGVVIIQFADVPAARAWYRSPAYQKVAKHRFLGADYRAFIVQGI